MSIISNVHALTPFISGTSKPMDGQRLLRIGYKKTKDNPSPLASVCASVPFLTPEEIHGNINALLPHIATMLEGVQDQVIRGKYEAAKGALKEVRTEELSVAECLKFLNAVSVSERLSAEGIKNWFGNSLAISISMAIITDALKYPGEWDELTEEQQGTVQKHVNVYCEVFQLLAGKGLSRESFSMKQWNRLEQILTMVVSEDQTDVMAGKLLDKMQVIAKAVKVEDII